jgi:hypothetical protein
MPRPTHNYDNAPKIGDPERLKSSVETMVRLGANDKQILASLDITKGLLTRIKTALAQTTVVHVGSKGWKALADEKIVETLYERAAGFIRIEPKTFFNKETSEVICRDTPTYYPPDISAIKYWLNNRQADDWSERASLDIKRVEKMSDRELLEVIEGVVVNTKDDTDQESPLNYIEDRQQ